MNEKTKAWIVGLTCGAVLGMAGIRLNMWEFWVILVPVCVAAGWPTKNVVKINRA